MRPFPSPAFQASKRLQSIFSGYDRSWLGADLAAGLTLAAVAIPECMGYTKIVGAPVVTGLYTILFPSVAFALLSSSRHLIVGADSATAAILFAGLAGLAQPMSAHWVSLTSVAALVTAGCLLVSGLLRLGFLADFLSRTVLVGFLSGVGVSVLTAQLPDMLGIAPRGNGFWADTGGLLARLGQTHLPTLTMALVVVCLIVVLERWSRRVPASLVVIVLAIAATWVLHLDQRGIAIVGRVEPGLPVLHLPSASGREVLAILPTCASMFLVIVGQSAATARSFAQKYDEPLDENRDLLGLAVANVLAGVTGTFVVNGSPTKTAIVDAAGSRTQVAQAATAAVVLGVLLAATAPIEHLPVAALAGLVFLIGVKLIDLRSLRDIYRFRKATFVVAVATFTAVIWLGIERGIFLAIALSVLDHLRQEYHPKDLVLVPGPDGRAMRTAGPGVETEPGLIVYRFEAPLFFANADYFAARVRRAIAHAPNPVRWLVLDLVSVSDIDYTGGLTLAATIRQLRQQGITVALVAAEDVAPQLAHLDLGPGLPSFASIDEALEAYRRSDRRHHASPADPGGTV
jgi:SulP family sulfate permease